MNRLQIRQDVFRQLREVSDAPVYWSADEVNDAINTTYLDMADETEWHEEWITIDLLNDRPYYDLRTVIGDTCLSIGPAYHGDTNRWLIPTTTEELDRLDRRWEVATGTPQRIIVKGLWWIGLWPRMQSATGSIRQYFTSLPDTLDADTDVPGIPMSFHDALTAGTVAELLAEDGQTTAAIRAWKAYLDGEDGVKTWVKSRVSIPLMQGYGQNAR